MNTIYFDMDGTIADLYNVPDWLTHLQSESQYPYIHAKPLINMQAFSEMCIRLQKQGFKIGIISWLSKNSTKEYAKKVRAAKREWINNHLEFQIDKLHIVKYGYNKRKVSGSLGDILVDDEENNIKQWKSRKADRIAIHVNGENNERIIMQTLSNLLNGENVCTN